MNAFYVNHRWLGGLLTNFQTIRKSIAKFQELRQITENADLGGFSNKAWSRLDKRRRRMEKTLVGIEQMERLPDAVCIVDPKNEMIAVQEARKLRIPIVAIVDTDCDPDLIDYVIPGNDDALRAIQLFASRIAAAFEDGRQVQGLTPFETGGDESGSDESGSDAASGSEGAASPGQDPAAGPNGVDAAGDEPAPARVAGAAETPAPAPPPEPSA